MIAVALRVLIKAALHFLSGPLHIVDRILHLMSKRTEIGRGFAVCSPRHAPESGYLLPQSINALLHWSAEVGWNDDEDCSRIDFRCGLLSTLFVTESIVEKVCDDDGLTRTKLLNNLHAEKMRRYFS